MNIKDISLRLALSKARSEEAVTDYTQAREETERALLKAVAETGTDRLSVKLPDGTKIGSITVKQGPVNVTVDEDALLAWVQEVTPSEIEVYADPAVLYDLEVLAWLREHRPESVKQRIRPVWRAAKIKEATENKGCIVNRLTGEETKVAEVVEHPPTGAFQFKPTDDGLAAVLAAHRAGQLPWLDPADAQARDDERYDAMATALHPDDEWDRHDDFEIED